MLESVFGGSSETSTAASPSLPSPPPPPPLLLTPHLFNDAVLPFVQRVRNLRGADNFSLVELGSWSGLYSLELATRYPRSTLVAIEPDRSIWARHATLARAHRRTNLVVAHNPVGEDVAEALSHANEFLDGQLLLSLHTTKPFDHGVTVNNDKLARLDLYIAHLLSLARRTLLLLPAAPKTADCRDNRLTNWAHASSGDAASKGGGGGGIAARLRLAAKALGLRVHATRRMRGLALDGCEYEVWESTLLSMDRTNRHHFCLGGCKTHTRRTYRMIYTAEPPADDGEHGAAVAYTPSDALGASPASRSLAPRVVRGVMNMSNTQTGRHIPFETGSLNMHSLLSLQSPEEAGAAVSASLATRQALILMFLSLPVFQDPAPWNVVWRAGELFPIDVGDGTTLEDRGGNWDTFAQKYIGSLNECYRMSLKWLCAVAGVDNLHGDDRYEACMSSQFGTSFCPSATPFPCLHGCNRSYQGCAHLPPKSVVPGYFARTNVHLRGKMAARFSQWTNASEHEGAPSAGVPPNERFGAIDVLQKTQERTAVARKAEAARRAANPKVISSKPPSVRPSKSERGTPSPKAAASPPSPPSSTRRRRTSDDDAATSPAPPPAPRTKSHAESNKGSPGASEPSEADAVAGLVSLQALRGLKDADGDEDGDAATSTSTSTGEELSAVRGLQLGGANPRSSSPSATINGEDGTGYAVGALTLLQLAMVAFVGYQLCGRSVRGRRLLRAIVMGRDEGGGVVLPPPRGGSGSSRVPAARRGGAAAAGARQRGVDSRLLGEL